MQDKSVGNRLQFSFQDVTQDDLILGVFDNLYRENEEFLTAFDLCRDDLQNQVQSILFQYEKLNTLYRKIDELCHLDLKTWVARLQNTAGKTAPGNNEHQDGPGE